ncbi:hypothetical protein KCU85_g892, partial [Aureobasidium melanogenum]
MPVTINKLSNEVFLDIFQYLDYFELKKCMRVNKTFNAIIKHTAFDRVLFRSATVINKDGIIKDATFATHPVLRHAPYTEKSRIKKVQLSKPHTYEDYDPPKYLLENKVADEQATSPPVSYLRITPCRVQTEAEIENPRGVTIRQLYEAMCNLYKDPATMPPLEGYGDYIGRFVLCHWVYYDRGEEFSPRDLLLGGYWDD